MWHKLINTTGCV